MRTARPSSGVARSVGKIAAAAALMVVVLAVATVATGRDPSVPTEEDGAVATEIERRFANDPEVNAQTVRIHVRGGVVTLTGNVPAEDAKARAEKIAATVSGVSDVRNELSLSAAGVSGDGTPGPIPDRMPGAE